MAICMYVAGGRQAGRRTGVGTRRRTARKVLGRQAGRGITVVV